MFLDLSQNWAFAKNGSSTGLRIIKPPVAIAEAT